jgi:hypothetical protein
MSQPCSRGTSATIMRRPSCRCSRRENSIFWRERCTCAGGLRVAIAVAPACTCRPPSTASALINRAPCPLSYTDFHRFSVRDSKVGAMAMAGKDGRFGCGGVQGGGYDWGNICICMSIGGGVGGGDYMRRVCV